MSDVYDNLSFDLLDEINQIDSSRLDLIPLLLDLIDETYKEKTVCGHNKKYKEIIWFYPSKNKRYTLNQLNKEQEELRN